MCGRYTLRHAPPDATHTPWRQYVEDISLFVPRYNIAPGQDCLVVRNREGEPVLDSLTWGFKPGWSSYNPLINARAENLLSSKMFKGSARHKRCLVYADGFYEPKGPKGTKHRPWHYFQYPDQRPFTMAGIWIEEGFAIITCEPNSQVAPIHDRMPLLIEPEHREPWLDSSVQDDREVAALLQSFEYDGMEHYPVGDTAKNPRNDGEECIKSLKDG